VEIEEKFLKLTHKMLSSKQAKSALELMWHLEKIDDINKIFAALSCQGLAGD
jgi:hypothetical protein